MTIFTANDVQSLETKLLALELDDGETQALAALVACAQQAADEVSGFDAPTGFAVGGLRFLTNLDTRPGGLLPDEGDFARAGGLGSTRVKGQHEGGSRS